MTQSRSPSDELTDGEFYEILQGQDEVGRVIRAHIEIERKLNNILELLVPLHGQVKPMDLDYFKTVHLVAALAHNKELVRPLVAMGNLRNYFAHTQGARITDERMKGLYKALSPEDKDVVQDIFLKLHGNRPDEQKVDSFKNLLPEDRYNLMVISVWGRLSAIFLLLKAGLEAGLIHSICECGEYNISKLNRIDSSLSWICAKCKKVNSYFPEEE